jgi:biotin synthase-related radical SAM superfamily protein
MEKINNPGPSPIDRITSQISCKYFSRAESKNVLIADVKNTLMDFHGDHTSTCTSHSGATKAHDWMVSTLGPLFRTVGHTVCTHHGVTATARRRGTSPIPADPG